MLSGYYVPGTVFSVGEPLLSCDLRSSKNKGNGTNQKNRTEILLCM